MFQRIEKRLLLIMFTLSMLMALNLLSSSTTNAASLTVTNSGTNIIVNTGVGLEYTINQYGDLASAKVNGIELNGSRPSHTNSGFPAGTVSYQLFDSGSTVLITVATEPFTHYYASRVGENTIYMATNVIQAIFGEFRYIPGECRSADQSIPESRNEGSSGPVESRDVYGHTDGRTTSKYYGMNVVQLQIPNFILSLGFLTSVQSPLSPLTFPAIT